MKTPLDAFNEMVLGSMTNPKTGFSDRLTLAILNAQTMKLDIEAEYHFCIEHNKPKDYANLCRDCWRNMINKKK